MLVCIYLEEILTTKKREIKDYNTNTHTSFVILTIYLIYLIFNRDSSYVSVYYLIRCLYKHTCAQIFRIFNTKV